MSENYAVIAIGASSARVEPLVSMLRQWPARSPAAVLLMGTSRCEAWRTDSLARALPLPIRPVPPGGSAGIEPGGLYVIPPRSAASLCRGVLAAAPHPGPSLVDTFFQSVAVDRESRAVGVLLPGTLPDGVAGLKAIALRGGLALTTQRRAAASPDWMLPPEAIGRKLARLAAVVPPAPSELKEIVLLLREATGVDFSDYRREFLESRVVRRMAAHGFERIERYLRILPKRASELQALYDRMLVPFSGFLPPGSRDALRERVLPSLLSGRPPGLPLRIWVPGCAGGEEAYSIAACLFDVLEETETGLRMEVFGTDLRARAIEAARAATYPEAIRTDVPPETLRRFFRKIETGYRVKKQVRDVCFFTRQNLARDEPFSDLDLISCRHVLMYLDRASRQRVLATLHRALRPGGFLLLGQADQVTVPGELFQPDEAGPYLYRPVKAESRGASKPAGRPEDAPWSSLDLRRHFEQMLLAEYAPPGVLVDSKSTVIEFRGRVAPYLEEARGMKPEKLVHLVRPELQNALRSALRSTAVSGEAVRKRRLRIASEAGIREVDLRVVPVGAEAGREHFAVLFEEATRRRLRRDDARAGPPHPAPAKDEIAELRQEMSLSSECLRSIRERHRAAQEASRSAEAEVRRLLAVFNSLDPVVLLGRDLSIQRLTGTAGQLLRLTPADRGRSIAEACSGFDGPDLAALAGSAIAGNRMRYEQYRADNRSYVVVARPCLSDVGQPDGVVLTFLQVD